MRIVQGMAAAALLVVGAAQAQAGADAARAAFERDFCHGLKRLLREAPDFVGMYNAHPAPPWLGFRPGACRAYAGTEKHSAAYDCHQHLAPAHLSLESLAAATAQCLPEAERTRGRWARDETFTLPGARILISESGGPGAKVGRIVGFRVEAVAD